ncbi:cytochrome P450 [Streptomyces sp. NPDC048272]|uniref:cytochrome P450 n=1 Tax=Streptomyces sp. NPDC048272 TaxID=3154616 RepID=UPI003438EC49
MTATTPIDAVRLPDPYPYYARLVAERPFAHDEELGAWVAADAAAVRAVPGSDALRVRPPAEPVPRGIVGTPAGEVFADLARMTDGTVQVRLKTVVADALARADTAYAARLAARFTREALEAGGAVPWEELMFGVPARVVAALTGLTDGADREAARAIADFVQCIPASATPAQQRAAAAAADRVRELLRPGLAGEHDGLLGELVRAADRASWPHLAPLLSNAVGFLSQTYDATAGLVGNTLVALARGADGADIGALVREVARYDAPIQNTRRFAATPFVHEGRAVRSGQQILVLLAAANRDPAVNPDPHALSPGRVNPMIFTFGASSHRCPGEPLASALAAAIVTELRTAGLSTTDTPTYRPLANARIPHL